jgi:hypothetical protein
MIAYGRNRRRRLVTLVTAVALVLQSFLAADVMAAFGASSGDVYRTITICTGYGYKQITLDAENNPVTPPPKNNPVECLACISMSNCLLALPVDSNAVFAAPRSRFASRLHRNAHAFGRTPIARQSRAPPL